MFRTNEVSIIIYLLITIIGNSAIPGFHIRNRIPGRVTAVALTYWVRSPLVLLKSSHLLFIEMNRMALCFGQLEPSVLSFLIIIYKYHLHLLSRAGGGAVQGLCYKQKGAGSVPDEVINFGLWQEWVPGIFLRAKNGRSVRKTDNLASICEPNIWKTCESWPLTNLLASEACYSDILSFVVSISIAPFCGLCCDIRISGCMQPNGKVTTCELDSIGNEAVVA